MRWLKHLVRKLRGLRFFILPVLAVAVEFRLWRRQDIPKRAIFCAAVVMAVVFSLIWWQSSRVRHGKRHVLHRQRRRRDDYR